MGTIKSNCEEEIEKQLKDSMAKINSINRIMEGLSIIEWLEVLRGALQAQWDFCNGCKYHDHPQWIIDENDDEFNFDETWCRNKEICENGNKFEEIPTIENILTNESLTKKEQKFFKLERKREKKLIKDTKRMWK